MPFTQEQWSFATMALSMIFTLGVKVREKMPSHSKRFFRLLIQEIENSCNGVEEAIERIVTTIRSTYRYSSLNFLLSDGAKLHAYGDYSQVKSRDYYGLMYSKKMLRCYYLSKSQYGKRSGQLSPIGV